MLKKLNGDWEMIGEVMIIIQAHLDAVTMRCWTGVAECVNQLATTHDPIVPGDACHQHVYAGKVWSGIWLVTAFQKTFAMVSEIFYTK